jgi:DNA-directed RNA polymerase sigma subunit (sigma70/sigma32)
VAENWEVRGLMVQIEDNLRKLSAREETLLRLLFGIGEPTHSRDEVERRLGMSSGWLRQIERRALRNLRSAALAERTTATDSTRRKQKNIRRGGEPRTNPL